MPLVLDPQWRSSLRSDVLPTALAAAGADVKPEWQIDGANLLPLLDGTGKRRLRLEARGR